MATEWLAEKLMQREFAAIGAVAVASAECELRLDHLITLVADVDGRTAEILTGHRMLRAKLDIVDRLFDARLTRDGIDDPKTLQVFRKIILNMHMHIDRRVLAMHGLWVTHSVEDGKPSPRAPNALSPRAPKPRKPRKEISIEQTVRLAKEIRDYWHADLEDFGNRLLTLRSLHLARCANGCVNLSE